MRIGIIGYGLIGRQRETAIQELRLEGLDVELVGIVDPVDTNSDLQMSLDNLIDIKPDVVIISTPHDVAASLIPNLLNLGMRLHVEKPIGRSTREFNHLTSSVTDSSQLTVGFNYPYFDGIRAAYHDYQMGVFGEPISLFMEIGHGGSPNDKLGWKLDPIKAGGGCLLDPGIHFFDLVQFFSQDLEIRSCVTTSKFWKTGIEEECLVSLTGRDIPIITVSVSIVRWRSTFKVQMNGTEGYGLVEGRGRSYGEQTYTRGKRWGWQNSSSQKDSEELILRSDCENSFKEELRDLITNKDNSHVSNSLSRMRTAVSLVDKCRELSGLPIL